MSGQKIGSRVVFLDTETTGLDHKSGHRIIEVGCVEMQDRRLTGNNLHIYLQPDREIDPGAMAVHGISNEFLIDKPRFAEIADELRDYLTGAELIIHNAPFDVGFLEHEFRLCNAPVNLSEVCRVTDSLAMARKQYPGQRNSLDALCKRLGVNNGHRTLHGALLDSEILADVYLVLTGGQTKLSLDQESSSGSVVVDLATSVDVSQLRKVMANSDELLGHDKWLEQLRKAEDGCAWDKLVAKH
ncbi:DNA polymerase III subunit epsilon [Granulosicoccus antarcticus]|uniref:DNA polymerase III subunit epsilon n=1 Tax=Granulosicoccus antarcticus IMCC3135 TaxID=1192854 RepID=A0A2Z2NXJ2_9GAMM|nr:DNA polymerase III subunit epsilon [Granulosicoccus antarcticus]ASJ72457.1 DNA polymerase III subunit epsilon [Granulosicoccus antarcticus IMCC3135]